MSRLPPPLRFLAVIVGGWAILRTAVLAPSSWVETSQASPAGKQEAAIMSPAPTAASSEGDASASTDGRPIARVFSPRFVHAGRQMLFAGAPQSPVRNSAFFGRLVTRSDLRAAAASGNVSPTESRSFPPGTLPRPSANRWSGSAWSLIRDEAQGTALAPGGMLGGSQAGARLLYRLNADPARPLAVSARLYLPLRRSQGSEIAAGIDWRPSPRLPLHLLAERRQSVGSEGRSAFALTVYGGHSGRMSGGLGFDSYIQAGVVGLRSRDLFIDGSARVWAPVGRFQVGGAAWGAAQPGAERLDAGPQISYRLPMGRTNLRLTADWRFRLAGDAAPGSGPAFTIASDF